MPSKSDESAERCMTYGGSTRFWGGKIPLILSGLSLLL